MVLQTRATKRMYKTVNISVSVRMSLRVAVGFVRKTMISLPSFLNIFR